MFFDPVSDLFGARGSSHSNPGGFSGAISRSGRHNSMEHCAVISRYCNFIFSFFSYFIPWVGGGGRRGGCFLDWNSGGMEGKSALIFQRGKMVKSSLDITDLLTFQVF